jgi:hypothetical protein
VNSLHTSAPKCLGLGGRTNQSNLQAVSMIGKQKEMKRRKSCGEQVGPEVGRVRRSRRVGPEGGRGG